MNQLLKDILNKNADFDRALQEAAGEGDSFTCFFCDCVANDSEGIASAPVGSSEVIKGMYNDRPRCLECEADMRQHKARRIFGSIL